MGAWTSSTARWFPGRTTQPPGGLHRGSGAPGEARRRDGPQQGRGAPRGSHQQGVDAVEAALVSTLREFGLDPSKDRVRTTFARHLRAAMGWAARPARPHRSTRGKSSWRTSRIQWPSRSLPQARPARRSTPTTRRPPPPTCGALFADKNSEKFLPSTACPRRSGRSPGVCGHPSPWHPPPCPHVVMRLSPELSTTCAGPRAHRCWTG